MREAFKEWVSGLVAMGETSLEEAAGHVTSSFSLASNRLCF